MASLCASFDFQTIIMVLPGIALSLKSCAIAGATVVRPTAISSSRDNFPISPSGLLNGAHTPSCVVPLMVVQ